MPSHVSIATAIDKGKLASGVVYIGLIEIDVLDRDTASVLTTIRLAHNNEPYVFRGQTYSPCGLNYKINASKGEFPTIDLEIVDVTLALQALMQEYQGGVDFPVRVLLVSSSNSASPEAEERFTILSGSSGSDTYNVTFEVGAENPLGMRFPWRLMFRNRCPWRYRGLECGYAGPMPTCDFTRDGANGCRAHDNVDRFGGFGGLRRGGAV
jgi:lambda family phage minor tail protein L